MTAAANYDELSYRELQKLCKDLGLKSGGGTGVLIERLHKADYDKMQIEKACCNMPAGQYYIGDLCYVMSMAEKDELFQLQFKSDRAWYDPIPIIFTLNDGRILVNFQTQFGDGCYYDKNHKEYEFGVDSGHIGCIKIDDIQFSIPLNATIVEFTQDFECSKDPQSGVLCFGHIAIDTGADSDENS